MRPALLLGALGLALAGPAVAQAQARDPLQVRQIFAFYDVYLGLAPTERDGLSLTYSLLNRNGAALSQQATMVAGERRVPIRLNAAGEILNPPDLAMWREGVIEFATPPQRGSTQISLEIRPRFAMDDRVEVAEVRNSLNDYRAALRRAGPLALAAPRTDGVRFVGAGSGSAVMADGRRVALPLDEGAPRFAPDSRAMRGAVRVELARAPTELSFGF